MEMQLFSDPTEIHHDNEYSPNVGGNINIFLGVSRMTGIPFRNIVHSEAGWGAILTLIFDRNELRIAQKDHKERLFHPVGSNFT
ncbi:hypothetical protein WN55_01133 [Dufourea novaeangliae]|uniref:Uncharacterized protein n=1 Tax=Dufourea novaeangliae TaxID=178035 RepID=A0A154PG32_DUFNO|nr:hypothetical protein WN55_01133 [Dufourea novaeangliae]